MKRDFIVAFSKPRRLIDSLRKIALGSAVAAIGLLGLPTVSSALTSTSDNSPLRPTIVERSGPSGISVGESIEMCHDRAAASRASRATRGAFGAPGPRGALVA